MNGGRAWSEDMGPCRFKGVIAICHPAIVDLEILTQLPTCEGPLRRCSLLDSLRKGHFPFVHAKSNCGIRVQFKSFQPFQSFESLKTSAQSELLE
jgi:hypothetical protein